MQNIFLLTAEMSDQKVIYSTLRFLSSPSESQNRVRPGRTQRPGKTNDKGMCLKHLLWIAKLRYLKKSSCLSGFQMAIWKP